MKSLNNITLPLTEQGTVAENRLEKGAEAQAKIFGEGMLKLAALGEEQMPREAYHLATNCFGDYYTRSGIELVTRELLTLAILINLGTEAQIKAYIFGNMSMGQSEDKIKQVAFTCLPYSGYPRLLNALNCIKEVFNPEK